MRPDSAFFILLDLHARRADPGCVSDAARKRWTRSLPRALAWVEWCLWGAGAILMGFAALSLGHRTVAAEQALSAFDELAELSVDGNGSLAISSATIDPDLHELSVDTPDQSLWSEEAKAHWMDTLARHVAPPIAALEIPRLSVRLAVLAGVDEDSLHRSVGWIPGTARPGSEGNVAIAGHRDSHFRKLKDVRVGDRLSLEVPGGTREYEVSGLRIIKPEHNSVLAAGHGDRLTLITCYPFYFVGSAPERYVVSAEPVPAEPEVADASITTP